MNGVSSGSSGVFTRRDHRNLRTFSYWALGMAVWFAGATVLLGGRFIDRQPAAWALPAIGLAIGVLTVRAYVLFLREADELLRKIHLEALAFAFGAGAIFMPVYRLCERLGAPKLDSVDPLLVIVVAWAIGQWRGLRRYAVEEDGQ